MLKILSWNIRQGGGSRTLKITRALIHLDPEIIVLSEYQNTERGQSIRHKLLSAGYRFQYVTAADNKDNSVMIVSKIPGNCVLHPLSDPVYAHNIIEVNFTVFSLIGVYLPHKKHHTLLPYINQIIVNSDLPYIIAGDFNTGKNFIDQAGNSFWYQKEMEDLETSGYKDVFRYLNGKVKEFSWYSHQGNGYRYDHSYAHNDLLPIVKNCYYVHEWREEKLSDHSPMVIELGEG